MYFMRVATVTQIRKISSGTCNMCAITHELEVCSENDFGRDKRGSWATQFHAIAEEVNKGVCGKSGTWAAPATSNSTPECDADLAGGKGNP
jgi:hypothetical protein